jgi:ribonuclease HI
MTNSLYIYTDGSFLNNKKNPHNGGWSAIFIFKGLEKTIYGYSYESTCTSNRMEMMGVLQSLELINKSKNKLNFVKEIIFRSDSQYTIKTCSIWLHNWYVQNRITTKKNMDMWSRIYKLQKELHSKFNIKYEWVKGHAGDRYNEMADELANTARKSKLQCLKLS